MASIRNSVVAEESLLDSARDCITAVGLRRTTITDVARRAGVSRMTVYRRWPDMGTLVADLMTRELTTAVIQLDPQPATPARVARAVSDAAMAFRDNPLFRKIVEVDPELLLPYLLVRRGRTQEQLLDHLRAVIEAGQRDGHLRDGQPIDLARGILLAAHGFVLSAHTLVEPADDSHVRAVFDELARMVEGYLS